MNKLEIRRIFTEASIQDLANIIKEGCRLLFNMVSDTFHPLFYRFCGLIFEEFINFAVVDNM